MDERYVYFNGAQVPYSQATISVHCNAVKYGTSVFEGLRAYWSPREQELYVFRLEDHIRRLLDSLMLMRMEHNFTCAELKASVLDILRKNRFEEDVHVRQTAYSAADGTMDAGGPTGLVVDARPRKMAAKAALDVCVSSWTRISDSVMPPRIKCSANYQNSRLAQLEARANGFDYAVLLNNRGKISEAPAACVFLMRGDLLSTPPITADILESVTRDTLIQLLRECHGHVVAEREIDRTELYLADEAFLCGTAWEVTPMASVDRLQLRQTAPGPLTRTLSATFHQVVRGELAEYRKWLTPVYGSH
jgi:branched-chain amino acid aminotransferase